MTISIEVKDATSSQLMTARNDLLKRRWQAHKNQDLSEKQRNQQVNSYTTCIDGVTAECKRRGIPIAMLDKAEKRAEVE